MHMYLHVYIKWFFWISMFIVGSKIGENRCKQKYELIQVMDAYEIRSSCEPSAQMN